MTEWIFVAFLLSVDGSWATVPPLVMKDEASCNAMMEVADKTGPGPLLGVDPATVRAMSTYCLPFKVKVEPIPKAPPVKPKPAALEIAI